MVDSARTRAAGVSASANGDAPSQFDKRLLIFSGKGGAGKSTVAAATAIAAARRGKRVLIVEIGDHERIPSIFGSPKSAGYAGGQVAAARAGAAPIWSMCLTAREALHDFAVRSVKFEAIYEAIFENSVLRFFTAAAPGLDELTIMGKIESVHRESVAPARRARFDLMIFDAPATGQGLAFFKVPLMAMRMARIGPLYARAERMWQLVSDADHAAFNIVTLPEEMSVNEAIELQAAAAAIGLPQGKVIVNGVYPDVFRGDEAALARAHDRGGEPADLAGRIARAALDAAMFSVARRRAQDETIARLAASLPHSLPQGVPHSVLHDRIVLPFLFSPRIGFQETATLADSLDGL
jgi:anion-transporting  ArsA/GET3 family ATPase